MSFSKERARERKFKELRRSNTASISTIGYMHDAKRRKGTDEERRMIDEWLADPKNYARMMETKKGAWSIPPIEEIAYETARQRAIARRKRS